MRGDDDQEEPHRLSLLGCPDYHTLEDGVEGQRQRQERSARDRRVRDAETMGMAMPANLALDIARRLGLHVGLLRGLCCPRRRVGLAVAVGGGVTLRDGPLHILRQLHLLAAGRQSRCPRERGPTTCWSSSRDDSQPGVQRMLKRLLVNLVVAAATGRARHDAVEQEHDQETKHAPHHDGQRGLRRCEHRLHAAGRMVDGFRQDVEHAHCDEHPTREHVDHAEALGIAQCRACGAESYAQDRRGNHHEDGDPLAGHQPPIFVRDDLDVALRVLLTVVMAVVTGDVFACPATVLVLTAMECWPLEECRHRGGRGNRLGRILRHEGRSAGAEPVGSRGCVRRL
mmetsp:Transcript_37068/g.73781  ORF Transcript_37068/g.73781 Transcript_37068/m.73781 type:complete len:341 (-) Transcript_37068:456-1478(-)